MSRSLGLVLRWLGRLLIVLAIYTIVASLFFPAGVQVLNPVVCPDNTELANARSTTQFEPANDRLELVCTGGGQNEAVGPTVLLITVSTLAAGLGALYVSSRLLTPRVRLHQDVARR